MRRARGASGVAVSDTATSRDANEERHRVRGVGGGISFSPLELAVWAATFGAVYPGSGCIVARERADAAVIMLREVLKLR